MVLMQTGRTFLPAPSVCLRRFRRRAIARCKTAFLSSPAPQTAVASKTHARIPVRPKRRVGYARGNKSVYDVLRQAEWRIQLDFDGSEDSSAHSTCGHE